MGIRGTGRKKRQGLLDEVAERDPELAQALAELRRASPAKYRKRIRSLAKKDGRNAPTSGSKLDFAPTPGRATDPKLRVGPGGDTEAADARAVATIRAIEVEKTAPAAPVEVNEPEEALPEPAPAVEAPKKKKGKKAV